MCTGILVILVIPLAFPGQQRVPGVVIVVVPLRGMTSRGSSKVARLSSFSNTRWMCRPDCAVIFPTAVLRSFRICGLPGVAIA